ncbi:stage V sporulation protein D [Clostridia bacterium]|nr:stage V sporulation protein D [Clostridia bacterium]
MSEQEAERLRIMNERKARNERRAAKRVNGRLTFIKWVIMLMILGLLARIWYIKKVHGAEYEREVLAQQAQALERQKLTATRGKITDRNNQDFATIEMDYRVILDVKSLAELDETAKKNVKAGREPVIYSEITLQKISPILGVSMEELRQYMAKNADGTLVRDTRYCVLGIFDYDTYVKLKSEEGLRCVYWEDVPKRLYQYDNVAPQVVGFIRGESKYGIESSYDKALTGVDGGTVASYEKNTSDIVENRINPINGGTVVTTIDKTIQDYAQNACDSAYMEYEAKSTACIVMNPMTGEILAMAQSPTFDLNDPTNIAYINGELLRAEWDLATNPELAPGKVTAGQSNLLSSRVWSNFNVSNTFEPGSIFKPIVVAAALEEGVITTANPATYYCGGYKFFEGLNTNNGRIRCHLRTGHGNQTLSEVLANSCNVAMMDIGGDLLGREKFYKHQLDFGYGEKTGIDLPAEASAKTLLYTLSQLNPVELATSSFGQGFACTPIQAINSFAAIINGGNLMQPYIVSKVVGNDGAVSKENKPVVVRKVVSKDTSDYLRKALVDVVAKGTGKKAAIDGYNIGGKTGTAEQGIRDTENKDYSLSFIAYLPAENPEVLVMAIITKPAHYQDGVTSAAPMIRGVLTNLIKYMGIQPTGDTGAASSGANGKLLPDFVGGSLTDAIAWLNNANIKFEIVGDGGSLVTAPLIPAAGSAVDADSLVHLYAEANTEDALIVVPNVVGETLESATYLIEKSGFTPFVDNTLFDAEVPSDDDTDENPELQKIVTYQAPTAGVRLVKGAQVKIR